MKMGAVGAAVAGLGARRARPASAAGTTNGVHIHATLLVINDGPGAPPGSTTAMELPPGAEIHFNVNIDVWVRTLMSAASDGARWPTPMT